MEMTLFPAVVENDIKQLEQGYRRYHPGRFWLATRRRWWGTQERGKEEAENSVMSSRHWNLPIFDSPKRRIKIELP